MHKLPSHFLSKRESISLYQLPHPLGISPHSSCPRIFASLSGLPVGPSPDLEEGLLFFQLRHILNSAFFVRGFVNNCGKVVCLSLHVCIVRLDSRTDGRSERATL